MTNPETVFSPLDDMRESVELAKRIDLTVIDADSEQFEYSEDGISRLMLKVIELNPHFGKEVELTGHVVPTVIDADFNVVLGEPSKPGEEKGAETVKGVCDSLAVRSFVDQETGKKYHRLVYKIHTDTIVSDDGLGNRVTKDIMTQVCAYGAEMRVSPYLDAHSMTDLGAIDDTVKRIEKVCKLDQLSALQRVKAIGGIANKFFKKGAYPDLEGQLVSYLNSLNPLAERCLLTADYLLDDPNNMGATKLSKGDEEEVVVPQHFIHVPDYQRSPDGGVKRSNHQGLYVQAVNAMDYPLKVPVKSIVDVA